MRKDIANKPTIEVAYSHSPKTSQELYETAEAAIGNITDVFQLVSETLKANPDAERDSSAKRDGIIALSEILESYMWDKVHHPLEMMSMRLGEQEKLNGVPR